MCYRGLRELKRESANRCDQTTLYTNLFFLKLRKYSDSKSMKNIHNIVDVIYDHKTPKTLKICNNKKLVCVLKYLHSIGFLETSVWKALF